LYSPTRQRTQSISIQHESVNAVRGTATVYHGNHTKYISTIHEQSAEFLNVEE